MRDHEPVRGAVEAAVWQTIYRPRGLLCPRCSSPLSAGNEAQVSCSGCEAVFDVLQADPLELRMVGTTLSLSQQIGRGVQVGDLWVGGYIMRDAAYMWERCAYWGWCLAACAVLVAGAVLVLQPELSQVMLFSSLAAGVLLVLGSAATVLAPWQLGRRVLRQLPRMQRHEHQLVFWAVRYVIWLTTHRPQMIVSWGMGVGCLVTLMLLPMLSPYSDNQILRAFLGMLAVVAAGKVGWYPFALRKLEEESVRYGLDKFQGGDC